MGAAATLTRSLVPLLANLLARITTAMAPPLSSASGPRADCHCTRAVTTTTNKCALLSIVVVGQLAKCARPRTLSRARGEWATRRRERASTSRVRGQTSEGLACLLACVRASTAMQMVTRWLCANPSSSLCGFRSSARQLIQILENFGEQPAEHNGRSPPHSSLGQPEERAAWGDNRPLPVGRRQPRPPPHYFYLCAMPTCLLERCSRMADRFESRLIY